MSWYRHPKFSLQILNKNKIIDKYVKGWAVDQYISAGFEI